LNHQFNHNVVMPETPGKDQIDIRAEIARVQAELVLFRERCLPAFFGTPIDPVFETKYGEWVAEKFGRNPPLSNWQRATCRLAELLPLGPLPANSSSISREAFQEFLHQPFTPSYCVRERRIIWQMRIFTDPSICANYCGSFPDLVAALGELPARLPEVRQWLMSLPVDSTELANILCLGLPFIADADPSFAKLALDPATWRHLVLADRDITEELRTRRLKWLDGQGFPHWLNNALLHTFGSLANNNFMLIEDFLDHPYLCGGYTHLFGHYLFAVLFEKVATLRRLCEERHELW